MPPFLPAPPSPTRPADYAHITVQLKGFTQKQTVGLLLDMDKYDRTLDLYVDGTRVGTAFSKCASPEDMFDADVMGRLPPGPLYPACSNGFDKAFCRGFDCDVKLPST